MEPLPLKLPSASVAQLQHLSDRMGCNRGALARALLLRGLAELEQATTEGLGHH